MRRYACGRNMSQRVAPVIQVPDARAMTGRYVSISFKLIGKSEKDANSKGEADAGREPSDVWFGWKPSAAERRDATLYRLAREARDFCGRLQWRRTFARGRSAQVNSACAPSMESRSWMDDPCKRNVLSARAGNERALPSRTDINHST